MSSQDKIIQEKYNIISKYINKYKNIHDEDNNIKGLKKINLDFFLEETLGIIFNYQSFLYRKDFFSRIYDNSFTPMKF
jgi:hypothetical protein